MALEGLVRVHRHGKGSRPSRGTGAVFFLVKGTHFGGSEVKSTLCCLRCAFWPIPASMTTSTSWSMAAPPHYSSPSRTANEIADGWTGFSMYGWMWFLFGVLTVTNAGVSAEPGT